MALLNLLLFLASFYGLMALIQKRLSIPAPQTPFVTMVLLGSVLYTAALFGVLLWISWLVFVAGLVSAALFLRKHAQNASYKTLIHDRTWYPAVTFGVLFLVGYFVTNGALLYEWDALSFWGVFTKILVYTNEIFADYTSIHAAEYPRGTALLQYYFVLFLNGGIFRDDLIPLAQATFCSSAVPAFLFSGERRFRYPIISCYMLPLVVFVYYAIFGFFILPVYAIYVDSVLALCWAMSIILYMMNKDTRHPFLAASIILFFMVQVKESALFFALTAIFVIGVVHILNSGPILRRKVLNIGFLFAVVAVSSVSWNIFFSISGVTTNTYTVDIRNISNLPDLEAYQIATIENYMRSLIYFGDYPLRPIEQISDSENTGRVIHYFTRPIFGDSAPPIFRVSVAPIYWTILFLIFMLLFSLERKTIIMLFGHRSLFYSLLLSLLLVTTGYLCLMLFLYLFSMSSYEAVRLGAFPRRIGTQYLGLFLILTFLIARMKKKLLPVLYCSVMLSFSSPGTVLKELAMADAKPYINQLEDIYRIVDPVIWKMKEDSQSKGSMFVINQGGRGYFIELFKYRAFPLSFPDASWYSILPEWKEGLQYQTKIRSPSEFGDFIKKHNFDYLIVWNDKYFWESYGDVVHRSGLKGIWHLQDGDLVAVK